MILSIVNTEMDIEREEYHLSGSREEPSLAVSGSCRENGKVRSGNPVTGYEWKNVFLWIL